MGGFESSVYSTVHDSSRIRYNLELFRTTMGVGFSQYVETNLVGRDISDFVLPPLWGYDIFCFDNTHVVLEIFPIS